MNSLLIKWKSTHFLIFALLAQFIANIAVFFDVPIIRQVTSFIFLIIIPGYLILSIINVEKIGVLEYLILSIGLSISFLMIAGLILNEIGPIFGIIKPLSLMLLMPLLNSFVLFLHLFLFFKRKNWRANLLQILFLSLYHIILLYLWTSTYKYEI